MLVMEMFDDMVTVDIIMGVTAMEALTVTKIGGEDTICIGTVWLCSVA